MNVSEGFARILVFVANFAFLLVGLALLVIGILYKVNFTKYTDTIPADYDALQYIPTIAIIVGAIIFFIAFLGCCGTLKSDTCMLSWYGAILIIIFVAQIALGIFALIKIKDRSDLESKIQQQLSVLFGKHSQKETMEVIDLIQTNFHCCGTTGPAYWTGQSMDPPKSCYDSSTQVVYPKGCSNVFPEFISGSVKLIGVVALVVSLVEVCGAILALCLAGCIRDKRREGAYY
ncbi:unnamed protein product [Ceutorhynchus assimilis]|uniref:Tetraspanin n=1 Tax=Ceutorhynchus assimilis TaxID=467358 RepID=A0A9N9MFY6_9CUCU|nr:unnamed protein product [Ceutorhynchus assimilis]